MVRKKRTEIELAYDTMMTATDEKKMMKAARRYHKLLRGRK